MSSRMLGACVNSSVSADHLYVELSKRSLDLPLIHFLALLGAGTVSLNLSKCSETLRHLYWFSWAEGLPPHNWHSDLHRLCWLTRWSWRVGSRIWPSGTWVFQRAQSKIPQMLRLQNPWGKTSKLIGQIPLSILNIWEEKMAVQDRGIWAMLTSLTPVHPVSEMAGLARNCQSSPWGSNLLAGESFSLRARDGARNELKNENKITFYIG